MNADSDYDDTVARLRALLDKALETGELPAELRPENQVRGRIDPEALRHLQAVAENCDEEALHSLRETATPLAGFNRGAPDEEDLQDESLQAARERMRKRREQERRRGREPHSDDPGSDR